MPKAVYCKMTLTEQEYKTFVYAVSNTYSYQMYLDDMPIWGMVGEVSLLSRQKILNFSCRCVID